VANRPVKKSEKAPMACDMNGGRRAASGRLVCPNVEISSLHRTRAPIFDSGELSISRDLS